MIDWLKAKLTAKMERDQRALHLRALGMSKDDAKRAVAEIDSLGDPA